MTTSARPDVLHELELLLRSGHGLVHLRTDEEERATSLLRHVADRVGGCSIGAPIRSRSLWPG